MAATNASKMAAAKKDVVSDTKEIVEDVKELMELRASWLMRNPKAAAGLALTVGLAVGVGVSYLAVNTRLKAKWQKVADEQVDDVKRRYTVERIVDDKPDLEELAEHLEAQRVVEEISTQNGYTHYNRAEDVVESAPSVVEDAAPVGTVVEQELAGVVVTRNVFESDNPDTYFDYEEELSRREEKPLEPFVLTQEEFNLNETDFNQQTLTYYDGDDVLADEPDKPIDDIDRAIGVENTLRFGHGSGDPNVVYIRNARLELDFEVTRSEGKFAKEVLGFDESELQHSDSRRRRKFRDSDE